LLFSLLQVFENPLAVKWALAVAQTWLDIVWKERTQNICCLKSLLLLLLLFLLSALQAPLPG